MGNCLRVSQGKTTTVEIVKPDGKVVEYRNPVKVRKVLTDFPSYGVSENLRQPPLWQLLCPETTLRPGRSYYLLPLISPPSEKEKKKKKKKVRFVDSSSSLDHDHEDTAVVSSSSSNSGEVVRIKMVVSKKELVEMMMMGRAGSDSIRDELTTCRVLRFPRGSSTALDLEDRGLASHPDY